MVLDSTPSRRRALRSLEALNVSFNGILNGIDCDTLEPLDDESLGVPVFDEYVDGVVVVDCAAAVRGLQIMVDDEGVLHAERHQLPDPLASSLFVRRDAPSLMRSQVSMPLWD